MFLDFYYLVERGVEERREEFKSVDDYVKFV